MKLFYKTTLLVLLFANVVLAVYVINNWQGEKTTSKPIPSAEITNNEIIKSYMQDITEKSTNKHAVVALISSDSSNCKRVAIANLLKKAKEKSPNTTVRIVLPKEFSEQDIINFKSNLDVGFEVIRENNELSNYWQPLAQKYDVLGVVIFSKEQELIVPQSGAEINKIIEML